MSCGCSWTSTYRSPAGPPPGPTSPCAASRTRMPSPTPAGILTLISRRARTRPSPPQRWHGSGMTSPTPAHTGHGRDVMTWPSSERCTVCTSPWPSQVSQVTGVESPCVPLPWHRSHRIAVSTVTCLVTPVAHSDRSSRIRSSESEPGRTRPIGPRRCRRRRRRTPRRRRRAHRSRRNRCRSRPAARALHRIATEVDDAALLRVAQHLVGDADLLELRLRRLVGVDVGMQFARELAVGALDLRVARALAHPEQAVIIACHA